MKKFYIKFKTGHKVNLMDFSSNEERSEYLRSSGFYESAGIYKHLNGTTAGIFSNDIDQIKVVRVCSNSFPKRSPSWIR